MMLRVGMGGGIHHGMTPTQGRPPGSPSERRPTQVYVDPADWERLHVIARAQDRSRSALVRNLIRREIEAHDAEQPPERAAA